MGRNARSSAGGEAMSHKPVTTLDELLALDSKKSWEAYLNTEKGDPEPGDNHSRAYHHGWRVKMMDLGEIPIPPEHRELTRQHVKHVREAKP